MAIPLEVLTAASSFALSGVMTIWSKQIKRNNELFKQSILRHEVNSQAIAVARKTPFSWMRKTLLVSLITCMFLVPTFAPLWFPNVDIVVGWTEMSRGFLWWEPQLDTVYQSFDNSIVITPLQSQLMSMFGGFLLGNQVTK